MTNRCAWVPDIELYQSYHDEEWGVPVHQDEKHFEFLVLDMMQAGLSWLTVLRKRDSFRRAFDDFNPDIVAKYGQEKINALLRDAGIIRNRRKIEAAVLNARLFLEIRKEFGTFDAYIWGFVGGRTIQNAWLKDRDIPAKTPESEQMSRELVNRGFKFVGPTICYAYMQAAGLVNDHTPDCFRYRELNP
jgi:DNA-3-methyladenine glycosylase I